MLKLLWKFKILRKFLRGTKRCRSFIEATGAKCDDLVIRGTPYCNKHQGKFPWFIAILPVLLGWVLGFVTPPLKSKYFPSESEQTLRKLAHQKLPELQFFVGDDSVDGYGDLVRAGIVIIPLSTNSRALNFSVQNMGDAPLENWYSSLIFDERLHFTTSLKKTDDVRLGPPPKGYRHTLWIEGDHKMPIYKPNFIGLPLTFPASNLINTPMNLNFDLHAQNVESFPVRLTIIFTPGTGPISVTKLPDNLVTNQSFVVAITSSNAAPK